MSVADDEGRHPDEQLFALLACWPQSTTKPVALQGFFSHGFVMESFDLEDLKVGTQKDDEDMIMLYCEMQVLFTSRAPPEVSSRWHCRRK